jgi:hypothetical protein
MHSLRKTNATRKRDFGAAFITGKKSISHTSIRMDQRVVLEYVDASENGKKRLEEMYPEILTPELLQALKEGDETMAEANELASEAYSIMDEITREIGMPMESVSNSMASTRDMFKATLAGLMGTLIGTGQEAPVPAEGADVARAASMLNSNSLNLPWHQSDTLLFAVMDYLPMRQWFVMEGVSKATSVLIRSRDDKWLGLVHRTSAAWITEVLGSDEFDTVRWRDVVAKKVQEEIAATDVPVSLAAPIEE